MCCVWRLLGISTCAGVVASLLQVLAAVWVWSDYLAVSSALLTITLTPLALVNVTSLLLMHRARDVQHHTASVCYIMHLCLLGPLWRYCKVMNSKKRDNHVTKQIQGITRLNYLQACLQNGPFLVVYCGLLFWPNTDRIKGELLIPVLTCSVSSLSLCTSHILHHLMLSMPNPPTNYPSTHMCKTVMCSTSFLLSRTVAVILFVGCHKFWILIILGCHVELYPFITYCSWKFFAPKKKERTTMTVRRLLLMCAQVYDFMPYRCSSTADMAVFYVLCACENAIMTFTSLSEGQPTLTQALLTAVVLVSFLVGILVLSIVHTQIHTSSGPVREDSLCISTSDVHCQQQHHDTTCQQSEYYDSIGHGLDAFDEITLSVAYLQLESTPKILARFRESEPKHYDTPPYHHGHYKYRQSNIKHYDITLSPVKSAPDTHLSSLQDSGYQSRLGDTTVSAHVSWLDNSELMQQEKGKLKMNEQHTGRCHQMCNEKRRKGNVFGSHTSSDIASHSDTTSFSECYLDESDLFTVTTSTSCDTDLDLDSDLDLVGMHMWPVHGKVSIDNIQTLPSWKASSQDIVVSWLKNNTSHLHLTLTPEC